MKIKSVSSETVYYVDFENNEVMYRTNGKGNWEESAGESWETVYLSCSQLETAFQEWRKKNDPLYCSL